MIFKRTDEGNCHTRNHGCCALNQDYSESLCPECGENAGMRPQVENENRKVLMWKDESRRPMLPGRCETHPRTFEWRCLIAALKTQFPHQTAESAEIGKQIVSERAVFVSQFVDHSGKGVTERFFRTLFTYTEL
jgi:hypothetical protein